MPMTILHLANNFIFQHGYILCESVYILNANCAYYKKAAAADATAAALHNHPVLYVGIPCNLLTA